MTEPRDPQSADSSVPKSDAGAREDEFEEQDDAVIGRALRRSLLVIAAGALIVLAIVYLRSRPVAESPEQVIDEAVPSTVPRNAEIPDLPFTDVTAESGVDFVHENGARGDKLLPESMGSGVALFDYDGDLDADLLLINSRPWEDAAKAPSSRLYRNDSAAGAIRFTDVSAETGIDELRTYGTGVAVADVDGDGRRDIFVAAVGSNHLLLAQPSGRFLDVTASAGDLGTDDGWSSCAAFFDADGDGDLDLFVGTYVVWSRQIDYQVDYRLSGVGRAYGPPVNYQGTFSHLYRNDSTGPGDVRFTDVSEMSGIQIRNEATEVPVGKALGALPIDADGDGWTDLLIANDTVRNFLFRNLGGNGTVGFEEVGELWGVAYGRNGEATGAMGVDAGFLLDAKDLGFAIGNFANEMTSLYLAQGDPTLYADDAIGLGIGAPSRAALTFGVLMLDVDLDGRLDLLQTNGHLETEINAVDQSQTYEQPSQLFWNAGTAARPPLVPVSASAIGDLADPIVGRGSATADLDGDGDLDVVVTQTGRRAVVLRNDQTLGQHWLRVVLQGSAPNIDAIGARLVLRTASGQQRAQINTARSYQSQSESVVTFGLGTSTEVESLEIEWPDGHTQTVVVDEVDRLLTVSR